MVRGYHGLQGPSLPLQAPLTILSSLTLSPVTPSRQGLCTCCSFWNPFPADLPEPSPSHPDLSPKVVSFESPFGAARLLVPTFWPTTRFPFSASGVLERCGPIPRGLAHGLRRLWEPARRGGVLFGRPPPDAPGALPQVGPQARTPRLR